MLDGTLISWPGGSPENTGLIVAMIVGAYLLILWLSAVVWTARDISQRTHEPIAQLVFTLIVLIFNFPGLVVYRVLRPPLTLQEAEEHELESSALRRELARSAECPNPRCGCLIGPDYLVCPSCGLALRRACGTCERVLDSDWRICPWCAAVVPQPGGPAGDNGSGTAPPAPAAAAAVSDAEQGGPSG